MRAIRTVMTLVTASALTAGTSGVAGAQSASQSASQSATQSAQQVTVPLTDAGRPATLNVRLISGGITIRGTNRKDVLVETQAAQERSGRRGRGGFYVGGDDNKLFIDGRGGRRGGNDDTTGLRRLTQSAGFSVEEENNVVQISSSANRGTDFVVQVPLRTNLKLSTLNDGPIVVENVEGEIEVNNQNESVTLTNVAGSVVANAHNGRVTVVMSRLAADKPMAFTSFNSNVDVTLPASVKANLKMRSDMGEIFTDFDVQIRPTPTPASQSVRGPDGRVRIDVNSSIQGAVNGGGPEIELRTFNGNIYVRKGTQ
jgi:hypothetical protein